MKLNSRKTNRRENVDFPPLSSVLTTVRRSVDVYLAFFSVPFFDLTGPAFLYVCLFFYSLFFFCFVFLTPREFCVFPPPSYFVFLLLLRFSFVVLPFVVFLSKDIVYSSPANYYANKKEIFCAPILRCNYNLGTEFF